VEIYCVNEYCAAFSTRIEEKIDKNKAQAVVKSLLREKELKNWDVIHIDMFSSGEKMLFLAYPGNQIKISIASYALPFIAEYFTE